MKTSYSSGKATVEDYLQLPEGAPYELIEGFLVKEPSPEYVHQKFLIRLAAAIFNFADENHLGEVLAAPMDVYLDEENVFQPDILFVSTENADRIRRDGIHGAPDLVIEILSPSNANHDLKTKLHIYEKYGVKEYFIVDPYSKDVTGYSLIEGRFLETYREPGILISRMLNHSFHF